MHQTKNPSPESIRQQMTTLIDARLSDAIDLMLQAKQAHWNVKGPHFIALHELFDEVHDKATEWVDTIAERGVILGGVARGTVQTVAQETKLPKYDESLTDGRAHVDALSSSMSVFAKHLRDAMKEAAEAGDPATEDMFIEVSRGTEKMLWFVESHLYRD